MTSNKGPRAGLRFFVLTVIVCVVSGCVAGEIVEAVLRAGSALLCLPAP